MLSAMESSVYGRQRGGSNKEGGENMTGWNMHPLGLSYGEKGEHNSDAEAQMKNLETRQREMRVRNQIPQRSAKSEVSVIDDTSEVTRLKKRISELETRVLSLEKENRELREQKAIIVERAPQKSYEDTVREQRHNFFKYSNVRRY